MCDAVTMEPYLWLYCDYGRLKPGCLLESDDSGTDCAAYSANAMGRNSAGRSDNMLTPNVLMLTKHTNGSLNLWQVCYLSSILLAIKNSKNVEVGVELVILHFRFAQWVFKNTITDMYFR